jgi:hypothetical protein
MRQACQQYMSNHNSKTLSHPEALRETIPKENCRSTKIFVDTTNSFVVVSFHGHSYYSQPHGF